APPSAAVDPERPKSELEIENESLRAARAAARPSSGGLWWFLVLSAATLSGGFALVHHWVRRRRRARAIREAVALPALRPVSPLLAAQWLPIRPRAGGLLVPGDSAEGGPGDS